MSVGKLRNSRHYRAKSNLLSWSGRPDWLLVDRLGYDPVGAD